MASFRAGISLIQGAYYLASGLWPLVHMRSFEAITGPKADRWLVKTVAVLVSIIGLALVSAGIQEHFGLEVIILALGSAICLIGIDVWYVVRKVIAPIYLLDAVAELVLLVCWIVAQSGGT
jgi:hypothetical protein